MAMVISLALLTITQDIWMNLKTIISKIVLRIWMWIQMVSQTVFLESILVIECIAHICHIRFALWRIYRR